MLSLMRIPVNQAGIYSVTVSNPFGGTNLSVTVSLLDLKMFAGLILSGPIGTEYRIEYVSTLGGTNTWRTLTNITLTTSPSIFYDVESWKHPQGFYRATPLP